jgi:ribose-phosphate pyrophosphokinase
MSLKLFIDGGLVPIKNFLFSGGEIQIEVLDTDINNITEILIEAHIHSSNDVMALLMLTNALRGMYEPDTRIKLRMPYIPYARQDRVCNFGEALSIKVFCDLINSQKYHEVEVWDAHSDVAIALLDNHYQVRQPQLVDKVPVDFKRVVLVSPDAGANKKIYDVAQELRIDKVVRADKTRNVATGEITGTVVYSEHVGDADFLIVDDIIDGGRTFIELGKVLKPLTNGKVILYATHGIFSKGLKPFEGFIDEIYVANPFSSAYKPFTNLMKKENNV